MDPHTPARAVELCRLMNERIRSRTPAERDRMMQLFIAQAQTPAERFKATGMLIDFALRLRRARKETPDAG